MSHEPFVAPSPEFPDYDDDFVQRQILDVGFDDLDMIREHLALTPHQRLERQQALVATLFELRDARDPSTP